MGLYVCYIYIKNFFVIELRNAKLLPKRKALLEDFCYKVSVAFSNWDWIVKDITNNN